MTRPHSDAQLKAISDGLDAGKKLDEIVVPPHPKTRLKNNNEESRSQKALIKWWSSACKKYDIPEQLLFAIPNGMAFGGKEQWQRTRSMIRGKNAKLEGLRVGVPDLMLAVPRGVCSQLTLSGMDRVWSYKTPGLFLEMKTEAGPVSMDQVLLHTFLRARGYKVVICRSTEEAIKEIETYLS